MTNSGSTSLARRMSEGCTMSIDTKNKLKAGLKTTAKVALVVGIVSAVAGGVLLAYMHFSGLGISKAGFTTLGKDIKAFWDSTNTLTNGQIAGVVGVTTAGTVTAFLVIKYAKPVTEAAMKKVNERRESFRFSQYRRAVGACIAVPHNAPSSKKLQLLATAQKKYELLIAIQDINHTDHFQNLHHRFFNLEETETNPNAENTEVLTVITGNEPDSNKDTFN